MKHGWKLAALLTAGLLAAGCGGNEERTDGGVRLETPVQAEAQDNGGQQAALPDTPSIPDRPRVGGTPPMPEAQTVQNVPGVEVQVVARGLDIPWALAFAPDGRVFFTERPGRIMVIPAGGGEPRTYLDMTGVVHRGEGGLMGLALHPDFARQPWLYVMYTTRSGGQVVNRVSRFRAGEQSATDEQVLIGDIPAAQFHDGGVVEFGPDGMLYVGTGDATQPRLAQDPESLAGKILRVTPEGEVPPDNPFRGSMVYAYGFRNVVGLAWNPDNGDLWAASHGPSGEFRGLRAKDQVYVVRKGENHGWPIVVGVAEQAGIVDPILFYPNDAVPPGGAIFYNGTMFSDFRGDFFLTSLGATHLQRVVVESGDNITRIQRWWPNEYGRLRAVEQAPDGSIWFTTSNEDGRAKRRHPGSDFIYRVVPAG